MKQSLFYVFLCTLKDFSRCQITEYDANSKTLYFMLGIFLKIFFIPQQVCVRGEHVFGDDQADLLARQAIRYEEAIASHQGTINTDLKTGMLKHFSIFPFRCIVWMVQFGYFDGERIKGAVKQVEHPPDMLNILILFVLLILAVSKYSKHILQPSSSVFDVLCLGVPIVLQP